LLPSGKNTNPCEANFEMTVTFTPTRDYDYLYLDLSVPGFDGSTNFIVLDAVDIGVECQADVDKYFDDNANNPSGGAHARYEHIYAGSSYFGGATAAVMTDPNATTVFEAKQHIEFRDNFLAAPNSGHAFLAWIDPNSCNRNCAPRDPGKPGTTPDGMIANNSPGEVVSVNPLQELSSRYNVYPNPSNGEFMIDLPTNGNYQVDVYNTLGMQVYHAKIDGRHRATITLNESLSNGKYVLQIVNTDGRVHTERISIIR
jgi:hypothetical protein